MDWNVGKPHKINFIVDIKLINDDEELSKVIYVPWHEEDQYENRYMKIHKEEGSFTIEIKPE